jgi:hypothetical protein
MLITAIGHTMITYFFAALFLKRLQDLSVSILASRSKHTMDGQTLFFLLLISGKFADGHQLFSRMYSS